MNVPKTNEEFMALAKKIESRTATEADKQAFDAVYEYLAFGKENLDSQTLANELDVKSRIFNAVEDKIDKSNRFQLKFNYLKYAAIGLIVCSIGYTIFERTRLSTNHAAISLNTNADIDNYNKAYLTLENGKKISLTDATEGKLLQVGGITVSKTREGQIVYQILENANENQPISYNTISTPNGGQYMVILPDKSQAWLNASSSIKFPTSFRGKSRNVEITGEVYFEVETDKEKPFTVKTGKAQVTVLGTHFNIMNYDDEPKAKISLLEGSIKLDLDNSTQLLKPGEQALFNKKTDKFLATIATTDDVIGWKKGYFLFDNTPIDEVLREVKRWYDVDIVFHNLNKDIAITAMVSRKKSLAKLLNLLKKSSDLEFEINNKQITVKTIKEEDTE